MKFYRRRKFKPLKVPRDTAISLTMPSVTIVNHEHDLEMTVRVTRKGLSLDYERMKDSARA